MKKVKLLTMITLILTLCLSFSVLTACEQAHTHSFVKEVAESKYLANEASCTQKATYYKSCECGEKGTETFEYGELLLHNYVDGKCSVCGGEKYTEGLVYKLNADGNSYSVIGVGTVLDRKIIIPSIHDDKVVTSIGYRAFYNCSSLTSVYYMGTASEWSKISIGSNNSKLKNATIYYYSETQPTESGNYWHYDTGGKTPVVWKKEN